MSLIPRYKSFGGSDMNSESAQPKFGQPLDVEDLQNKTDDNKAPEKFLKTMYLQKMRRCTTCILEKRTTSAVSPAGPTNLAACIMDPLMATQTSTSTLATCIVDPLKAATAGSNMLPCCITDSLKVLHAAPLNPLLAIKASEEETEKTEIAIHLPRIETKRTMSSPYVSAIDDYDTQGYEESDVEEELETDVEVFSVPEQEAVTPKSKNTSENSTLVKKGFKNLSSKGSTFDSEYRSTRSSFEGTPRSVLAESHRSSEDTMLALTRCIDFVSNPKAFVCRSANNPECCACSNPEDSTVRKLIVDLIGPQSRVGKMILQACHAGQDSDAVYEEIKQHIGAELEMESKLASFFQGPPSTNSNHGITPIKSEALRNIDDTLMWVKDHLSQMHADMNEFKEHSLREITNKVSYTEFQEANDFLRMKVTSLEQQVFNEQRIMRQDIKKLTEKSKSWEDEIACGLRSIPIWPVFAFLSVYSLMQLGRH